MLMTTDFGMSGGRRLRNSMSSCGSVPLSAETNQRTASLPLSCFRAMSLSSNDAWPELPALSYPGVSRSAIWEKGCRGVEMKRHLRMRPSGASPVPSTAWARTPTSSRERLILSLKRLRPEAFSSVPLMR